MLFEVAQWHSLRPFILQKSQLYESANKAKEGMVVKYAMSEKSVITVRKDLELAERRLREANKARDLLSDRLKTVQSEKEKANNLLETKVCIHTFNACRIVIFPGTS